MASRRSSMLAGLLLLTLFTDSSYIKRTDEFVRAIDEDAATVKPDSLSQTWFRKGEQNLRRSGTDVARLTGMSLLHDQIICHTNKQSTNSTAA